MDLRIPQSLTCLFIFPCMQAAEDGSLSFSQLSQSVTQSVDDLGLEKFGLNDSQLHAVADCVLSAIDNRLPSLKLIWGPPGTGKTKTICTILWAMLMKGLRTLTCAPTNTAVLEVASRIVRLVEHLHGSVCFLNDIVLFGSKEKMKIGREDALSMVFLDSRAKRLLPCFMPTTGWMHCLRSLMDHLESPITQYRLHLEKLLKNEKKKESNKGGSRATQGTIIRIPPFKDFFKGYFNKVSNLLRKCVETMYNDHPRSPETGHSFQCMLEVLELIGILQELINCKNDDIWSDEFHDCKIEDDGDPILWSEQLAHVRSNTSKKHKLKLARSLCVRELRYLHKNLELPGYSSKRSVETYLLQRAKCILCTVSSSFRLYNVPMDSSCTGIHSLLKGPETFKLLDMLIVDEAAQLKECETLIPLQLPGIRQAVFVGDEYQLPALVRSKVSSLCVLCFFFQFSFAYWNHMEMCDYFVDI